MPRLWTTPALFLRGSVGGVDDAVVAAAPLVALWRPCRCAGAATAWPKGRDGVGREFVPSRAVAWRALAASWTLSGVAATLLGHAVRALGVIVVCALGRPDGPRACVAGSLGGCATGVLDRHDLTLGSEVLCMGVAVGHINMNERVWSTAELADVSGTSCSPTSCSASTSWFRSSRSTGRTSARSSTPPRHLSLLADPMQHQDDDGTTATVASHP